MEEYKISETETGLNGGYQAIYKFENGYGASVVKSRMSYGGEKGLYELGLIIFLEGDNWELFRHPKIGELESIIGWLDENGVNELLEAIKEL